MIRSNAMASTVSHAEDCLYQIKDEIEYRGSSMQQMALQNALNALETLYFMLQEDE